MERAASLREQDPVEAVRELRAAVASLRVATHPVEFGLAHYDLAGLLLEGDAPTDVLEEAARAAARALLVFDPQELPDLFAGASERLGMAQWQAGRRKDAQRTFRQTAGSLAAVQRFGLGARLLAIQARLMGHAARLYRAMGTAWAQRPGGDRVENLRQADGALQSAIDRMPDDAQRDERASMWNERGLAQAELAQRGIPGAVTATVMAFREGLEAAEGGEATALEAQLANNLGSAIMTAASQGQEASLADAGAALDRAAKLWTSLGQPADAGASQLNAGLVYMTLHSTERHAAHLNRAIERLQGASAARPLGTHPGPHAATQFNLGMALAIRAGGTNEADLAASVAAFRTALQVWTGPNAPPQAAVAHANLGSMLFGMAKQNEPALLQEAAYHYEQALAVYTPATNPQQHQVISNNLALLRRRQAAGNVSV